MNEKKNDYSIGYKKPPQHTQFKSGQSGNPKGRPKGSKNLATDVKEELESKIIIIENGKRNKVTKQRAVIKKLSADAMSGNPRSASLLLNLKISQEQSSSENGNEDILDSEDQAIIQTLIERYQAKDEKSQITPGKIEKETTDAL